MIDYAEYKGFTDPENNREVLIAPGNKHMRTRSLFAEFYIKRPGEDPLYSMRDYENKGLVSAYQVYMHSIDEAEAALKLVGSMRHWRLLCTLDWFMKGSPDLGFDGLLLWREDMKARDITMAKKILMKTAKDGDPNSAQKLINHANGSKRAPRSESVKKTKSPEQKRAAKILELHKAKIQKDQNG